MAFHFTGAELAIAVPAGVVLGAIVSAVASYFGAKAAAQANARAQIDAAREARRLAFDQRLWDRKADFYTSVINKLSPVTTRLRELRIILQWEAHLRDDIDSQDEFLSESLLQRALRFKDQTGRKCLRLRQLYDTLREQTGSAATSASKEVFASFAENCLLPLDDLLITFSRLNDDFVGTDVRGLLDKTRTVETSIGSFMGDMADDLRATPT